VGLPRAAWYEIRRAQNRKPATYTCPLCGGFLPSMTAHALVSPEGDTSRRRHAHLRCVVAAREAGRLPTRDDLRRAERGERRGWRGWLGRLRGS
jgi:hypothetical protein